MRCEFYQYKQVTARKPHRCAFCDGLIPRGAIAHMESGKFDGEFFRRYCCNRCWPLTNEFWEYVDGICGIPISTDFEEFLMRMHPDKYEEIFGEDDE